MKTIWKYEVQTKSSFYLDMPEGALVLSVQMQRNVPCILAKVDTEARTRVRQFAVVGTGNPIHQDTTGWCFVGTFQLLGGDVVLHLFEVPS